MTTERAQTTNQITDGRMYFSSTWILVTKNMFSGKNAQFYHVISEISQTTSAHCRQYSQTTRTRYYSWFKRCTRFLLYRSECYWTGHILRILRITQLRLHPSDTTIELIDLSLFGCHRQLQPCADTISIAKRDDAVERLYNKVMHCCKDIDLLSITAWPWHYITSL